MLRITDDATADSPARLRPLRRWEYQHLCRAGAFDDEDLELLGGALVQRGDRELDHDRAVARAAARLRALAGAAGRIEVATPWPVNDYSVARPDVRVHDVGGHWHGGPPRAALVVEVAGSTVATDRGLKLELYAHAAVDEYWLVDLSAGAIECWRERDHRLGTWGPSRRYPRGQVAAHGAWPALALAIDALVPLPWDPGPRLRSAAEAATPGP